jgi:nucleoside-triphosphatase THEP1
VVGDYTISRDGILFARGVIKQAVQSRCDLVVIDEVGPLELRGKGLMPAVELALASPLNVLIVVRSSLKEALQRRFPEYEFVVVADLTQSPKRV